MIISKKCLSVASLLCIASVLYVEALPAQPVNVAPIRLFKRDPAPAGRSQPGNGGRAKAATPKATTPKQAGPKAVTPKAATPKPADTKVTTPKAATPNLVKPKPQVAPARPVKGIQEPKAAAQPQKPGGTTGGVVAAQPQNPASMVGPAAIGAGAAPIQGQQGVATTNTGAQQQQLQQAASEQRAALQNEQRAAQVPPQSPYQYQVAQPAQGPIFDTAMGMADQAPAQNPQELQGQPIPVQSSVGVDGEPAAPQTSMMESQPAPMVGDFPFVDGGSGFNNLFGGADPQLQSITPQAPADQSQLPVQQQPQTPVPPPLSPDLQVQQPPASPSTPQQDVQQPKALSFTPEQPAQQPALPLTEGQSQGTLGASQDQAQQPSAGSSDPETLTVDQQKQQQQQQQQQLQGVQQEQQPLPSSDPPPGSPEAQLMQSVRDGEQGFEFDPDTKQWTDPATGQKFQEANNQLTPIPLSGNPPANPDVGGQNPPTSGPPNAQQPATDFAGQPQTPGTPPGTTPGTPPGTPLGTPPGSQSPPAPPGAYRVQSPGSTQSASQAGTGGAMPMPNSNAVKTAAQKGVQSEIQDPQQAQDAMALYLGAVGTETSGGQNMPNDADQARRGKLGNDMEEIGPARIGRGLWKRMGYSEEEIQRIKADGNGAYANEQSARVFAKGPQELGGMRNFMAYQRGGVTMYNQVTDYRDAAPGTERKPLSAEDEGHLNALTQNYQQTQQEALDGGLTDVNNNQVPYLQRAAEEI
ncbi:hypothetical protein MIR68_009964 [Amoeboaphelidium protococcarum]|nr:hypothetical protein MIR68_009964 [Amoeboaphelidium protococcarum]